MNLGYSGKGERPYLSEFTVAHDAWEAPCWVQLGTAILFATLCSHMVNLCAMTCILGDYRVGGVADRVVPVSHLLGVPEALP